MKTTSQQTDAAVSSAQSASLNDNQFSSTQISPGSALLVGEVAVFDVQGKLCATQAKCPHKQGPLNEGRLDGSTVTCPWHGSQFDVCSGAVLRGPAVNSLKTYRVTVEGDLGTVETS
jgi:nitrite reductase/ring-hydroxylating ferredoxin subunit